MDRREKYRKKALECLIAAENLRDPAERVAVLQIAQSWMSLADHVGGQRDQSTAHRSVHSSQPQSRDQNDG